MKFKLRHELTEAEIERRRENGRKGGLARAQQFTSASQRAARRKVKPESLQAAGRKGAQVTAERHGYEILFERAREYRLNHPSPNELVMIGILARMGVKYEREYRLRQSFHTVDFHIESANLAIEVEGSIHDPGKPNFEKRQDAKQRKAALLRDMRKRVLTVTHVHLQDVAAVIEIVKEHLK